MHDSNTHRLALALHFTLFLAPGIAAQASAKKASEETPPWESVNATPAWATDVPARAGCLRFVILGSSNVTPIAQRIAMKPGPRAIAQSLDKKLIDALGADLVAEVAAVADTKKHLVRRAHAFRTLTRRMVPGNTLAEAWTLWEVPIADILAGMAPADREKAVRVLLARKRESAWRLEVAPKWIEAAKVEVMESAPPQFALVCTASMPSPGWKLAVDKVTKRDASGRIRAYVTGTAPTEAGRAAKGSATLRLRLGQCEVGMLAVEVFFRSGETGAYVRRDVVMLNAAGR